MQEEHCSKRRNSRGHSVLDMKTGFNQDGKTGKFITTHKMTKTPTYISWLNMTRRCGSIGATGYLYYGGRGIRVCSDWKKFENFYRDMGKRPEGTTLDRIDCNGNYEPSNCRWASHSVQRSNTRKTKLFNYNGEMLTMTDIAKKLKLSDVTFISRMRRNKYDIDRCLFPLKVSRRKIK